MPMSCPAISIAKWKRTAGRYGEASELTPQIVGARLNTLWPNFRCEHGNDWHAQHFDLEVGIREIKRKTERMSEGKIQKFKQAGNGRTLTSVKYWGKASMKCAFTSHNERHEQQQGAFGGGE